VNDLEEQLADELTTVATNLDPPSIDIPALTAAGRRERLGHRAAAGVLSVAAVVALGVGIRVVVPGDGQDDTPTLAPTTAHDGADLGRALELPWWGWDGQSADPTAGILRVGGTELPVNGVTAIAHEAGVTLVEQAAGSWSVLESGALSPLAGGQAAAAPVEGDDGVIAYVVADAAGRYAVVREQGRQIATEPLDTTVLPAVVGLAGDRVFVTLDDQLWVWTPADSSLKQVNGLPRGVQPSDVHPRPGGVASEAGGRVVAGVVSGTRFHPAWGASASADGVWSDDGQTYAAVDDAQVSFSSRSGTTAVSLSQDHLRVVGWESADEVVVAQWLEQDGAVTGLWRCSAAELRCAPIDDPNGRVLLPGLPGG
jgi:hypothetical protein